MSKKRMKVVHYMNQFFGQVGAEDKADTGFTVQEGPVGPGLALQKELGEGAEVIATLICGDNYFSKNPEDAAEEGFRLISSYKPDLFFAGPAFEAGRYGVSCGAMCKKVGEELGILTITGMYEENPGVEIYQKYAYICKTGQSARDMTQSLRKMTMLALKLVSEEEGINLVSRENIPRPDEYGYFPRLIMRNEYTDKTAAERSVDKLLSKIKGEPFESEVVPLLFEEIEPPAPIEDLGAREIAFVSDGGLVAKGNPDKLKPRDNIRWATYDIDTLLPPDVTSGEYEVTHTGYYPDEVLEDPNRLVPVTVMRDLVKEGTVGKLHPTFFSTSGNATAARACAAIGEEIANEIKKRGIDAIILTST